MSTNTALDQIKARVEGHTEGPWEWAGTPARRELHGAGGEVMTCATLLWPDKPDAELIAAAPKLLAALEAVEAGLTGLDVIFDGTSEDDEAIRTITEGLRAAIEEALR